MSLTILKIDNSLESSIKDGKWENPGAKLYNRLLNAMYYKSLMPENSKDLDNEVKKGNVIGWETFLKEAYLVAPVKNIKNSPYGVTPYSRSGCKYPHHVIKGAKIVLSIPGVKAAYARARQQGIFSGDVKEHLERHYKELGIYEDSTMQINEKINNNFMDIISYIIESNNKDLNSIENEKLPMNIRELNKSDVINPYFVKWFFKMDEFNFIGPEEFDFDILVHEPSFDIFSYGYFIDNKLEGIVKLHNRKDKNYYAISFLFVNEESQSNGIGQILLKFIINKFGDNDLKLNVFVKNKRAIHIYEKYGFKIIEEFTYNGEDGHAYDRYIGEKIYKMARLAENNKTLTHYDPPMKYEDLPNNLKDDPIHAWRAKTGIELIHKEPTLEELNRIWDNWQLMTDEQKDISNKKSIELFKMNNEDHYKKLLDFYNDINNSLDDLDKIHEEFSWMHNFMTEKYLMEEIEEPPSIDETPEENQQEEPPSIDEEPEENPEEKSEEPEKVEEKDEAPDSKESSTGNKLSYPKQTDAAESDKNGIRRKKLYIAFIQWCKEFNPKNTFGSVFDKDVFNGVYPFVPDEMRYFYRLANPMLCVLSGDLTFFALSELRKVNNKNPKLYEVMIFAATKTDFRIFNKKDKKIYRGTEENGSIKLGDLLCDTFDDYIQKMIDKGDILTAPLDETV